MATIAPTVVTESSRHDRAVGVACLVVCPAISGLFVGVVAIVCVSATGAGTALRLGSIVGVATFVANTLAICLTASTVHARALHRARRAARDAIEVARITRRRSHSQYVGLN